MFDSSLKTVFVERNIVHNVSKEKQNKFVVTTNIFDENQY